MIRVINNNEIFPYVLNMFTHILYRAEKDLLQDNVSCFLIQCIVYLIVEGGTSGNMVVKYLNVITKAMAVEILPGHAT